VRRKACIASQRVRVLDIVVWHEHRGMTADEIVSHIPTITLADVHAALADYFDHVDEIQQEMRDERAHAEDFRRSHHPRLRRSCGNRASKRHPDRCRSVFIRMRTSLPISRPACDGETSM
jgi:uncharacterized protein (DUF433 family)